MSSAPKLRYRPEKREYKSCCGCFMATKSAILVGILSSVAPILCILSVMWFYHKISVHREDRENFWLSYSYFRVLSQAKDAIPTITLFILGCLLALPLIIADVLMLIGLHYEKPEYFRPYLVKQFMLVLLARKQNQFTTGLNHI